MAKQFGIIFACLLAGELIAMIPGVSIPGSIIGMLVLTVLLERKVVKPDSIAPLCRFLIKNMAFFFVPPGVALMLYFDIIAAEWIPITVATVVSIFLVIVVTGRLHQFMHRRIKRNSK
ncbi:MAG: CidA/LrgA family protein [Muribaculaceae bacterium]|jgi:holin-like protein|uniref:CidA/LrgA family protein n=1 Tax=Sangeribacter muris TaxID=2880703 RepID=UPI000E9522B1|nr:CidA/LrgA family protein [Sangeribacter muris]MBJ2191984.1 CidA/LrgA family protein [Muribaculaceae bacterium]ROS81547.1 CidA/LrgA family protein [Muribaculaceae bacterium Isolate-036 (Harlan)]ROT19140.1 CidA/LrgA family protein [Muribaculaceae bacterium Isolate-114 (HZI)]ROT21665.1 CidA/LrgA family protein [Muribaculaceae bacterium Isolate-113 (HZI)]HBY16715.1 CidA/LrgA family protein [Porphyromonadaceae bacterium]